MAKLLVRLEVHGCKADLGLQAIEEIEDSDQDWQQSQQTDALRGDHQAKRKANQANSQQQRKPSNSPTTTWAGRKLRSTSAKIP